MSQKPLLLTLTEGDNEVLNEFSFLANTMRMYELTAPLAYAAAKHAFPDMVCPPRMAKAIAAALGLLTNSNAGPLAYALYRWEAYDRQHLSNERVHHLVRHHDGVGANVDLVVELLNAKGKSVGIINFGNTRGLVVALPLRPIIGECMILGYKPQWMLNDAYAIGSKAPDIVDRESSFTYLQLLTSTAALLKSPNLVSVTLDGRPVDLDLVNRMLGAEHGYDRSLKEMYRHVARWLPLPVGHNWRTTYSPTHRPVWNVRPPLVFFQTTTTEGAAARQRLVPHARLAKSAEGYPMYKLDFGLIADRQTLVTAAMKEDETWQQVQQRPASPEEEEELFKHLNRLLRTRNDYRIPEEAALRPAA